MNLILDEPRPNRSIAGSCWDVGFKITGSARQCFSTGLPTESSRSSFLARMRKTGPRMVALIIISMFINFTIFNFAIITITSASFTVISIYIYIYKALGDSTSSLRVPVL